ncbi:MAG: KilA-N domain-containing protein [Candidatus Saccharibacteria bacterium]|nr:KilA-N domain-containing protein [Candidatus Saccharibacteria bacterium]
MPKEKPVKETIIAAGTEISVLSYAHADDYISLTDIAKYRSDDPAAVIQNWLRNRDTIEFLGLWEQLNNPDFNLLDFEGFKSSSGQNAFTLSPQKWIRSTHAIGLTSKSGRYGGGTFAHKDIAFEFASWISPEFKLYIIKDYQRLKQDESHRLALDWNVNRVLAKTNYRIHTDAIKANLIPVALPAEQHRFIYADEADVLNVALFGMTAKQWREQNPSLKGNMRDYATIEQLLVLVNLETMNALLIEQGKTQDERMHYLNHQAIKLMQKLSGDKGARDLHQLHNNPQLPDK